MAQKQYNEIRTSLTTLFSPQWINRTMKECGFIQRKRKFNGPVFFWSLILSFATGKMRILATIRRSYLARAKKQLCPSSFYGHIKPELSRFMKEALKQALDSVSRNAESLEGRLEDFKDLLIADASVIRLHRFLSKQFPACRTNHTEAAAKLHMVISMKGNGPHTIKITKERINDSKVMRIGQWIKGMLLLFDLGFYSFGLFSNIRKSGGFFISRMKKNANPLIVVINGAPPGNTMDIDGKRLQDVIAGLRRKVLDCEIEVSFQKRAYGGKKRRIKERFRLVGVWNSDTQEYHLYVTNVDHLMLSAEEIARIYEGRWQVELLFKELKYHYRLDQIFTERPEVVEILIYAAVIALVVSKSLLNSIRKSLATALQCRLKELRWASVFSAYAEKIFDFILRKSTKSSEKLLIRALKQESIDPNAERPSLMQYVSSSSVR